MNFLLIFFLSILELSVFLILQPRFFIYKRKQKNRQFYHFKNSTFKNNSLKYGSVGLRLLHVAHLSAKRIFRLKLYLKRASRKSDYTKRFVWFNAFPHLPITKKPSGTRMGKGKGKLEAWFTTIYPGTVLVEFKNLRYGRAFYFCKQVTFKLGVDTKTCLQALHRLPRPISLNNTFLTKVRW